MDKSGDSYTTIKLIHPSDPEPAPLLGLSGLQNMPDTDLAVPEPSSVPGVSNYKSNSGECTVSPVYLH